MELLGTVWRRLRALIRGNDQDLDDELAFHLAMREAKNRAADVPAGEAQAAAKRQFGNVARIKEACREMHTLTFLETFWQDVRYGARGLKHNPVLALIVIVTLALGIGVSSWNFAILNQWVINAVSFPHPDRLVVLWEIDTRKGSIGTIPAPDYLDWKRENQVMETLSAWSSREFSVTGGEVPQRISGGRVSADFFRTLDVRPFLGRDFLESDDQQGAAHVAIVSYGFWRERLGGDPNLAGATLKLDGESYAVVGVMPDDFHFTLMGRANIWVPVAFPDSERADRSVGSLQVVGRLKPGITLASAREAMNVIASNLEKAYPETNTNAGIQTLMLSQEIGRHVGNQGMYTGFVVGICILLIACSNVAGLYLARTLGRRKEMTMRLALGARRGRLARQLLSENILLLPAAIGLGLALAAGGANWLTAIIPYENRGYLPNYGRIHVDSSTMIFALLISALSVLLFSLAPILEGYKLNLTGVLKEIGSGTGSRGQKLRKTLVVAQVVLALTTLVPTGLMVRFLIELLSRDPGFRADHVLTARLSLPAAYVDDVQWRSFYDRLLDGVRALPQVENVGASQYVPFGHHNATAEFRIEGKPEPGFGKVPATEITASTPGYAPAIGLTLLRGRFLSEQDRPGSMPAVVINQTLERRYFANEDPVGRRIRLGHKDPTWYTVVGVVGNVKLFDLSDRPENQCYFAFAQMPVRTMSVVLRTSADPKLLSDALRKTVSAIDKELPISDAETMEQSISDEEAPFRISAQCFLYLALLALFLAGMGIYGVLAYLVASRTREIGIRIACGAEPRNILWLVLSGSLKLVILGIVLGLAGGWAVTRLLSGLLNGVAANASIDYLVSIAAMVLAILLASFVPLRRATRVDPMLVLRYE